MGKARAFVIRTAIVSWSCRSCAEESGPGTEYVAERGGRKLHPECARKAFHTQAVKARRDSRSLVDVLALVDRAATPEVVAQWTPKQRNAAWAWASAVHLRASDNPRVRVPEEPPHVAKLPRMEMDGIWPVPPGSPPLDIVGSAAATRRRPRPEGAGIDKGTEEVERVNPEAMLKMAQNARAAGTNKYVSALRGEVDDGGAGAAEPGSAVPGALIGPATAVVLRGHAAQLLAVLFDAQAAGSPAAAAVEAACDALNEAAAIVTGEVVVPVPEEEVLAEVRVVRGGDGRARAVWHRAPERVQLPAVARALGNGLGIVATASGDSVVKAEVEEGMNAAGWFRLSAELIDWMGDTCAPHCPKNLPFTLAREMEKLQQQRFEALKTAGEVES